MGGTEKRNYVEECDKYARDVVDGTRSVCKWVKLACKRHLDDRAKENWDYFFDEERAAHFCKFFELLPHIKGRWKTKTITLEPWQCFMFCVIFGWRNSATGLRRFRKALVVIPARNGKALDLNTPIATPEGWTTMGQLSPGDVVFGGDGQPCNVTVISPVYYDHQCYRLTFSNGEQVIADAGHLWNTTAAVNTIGKRAGRAYPKRGETSLIYRTRTTQEIYETQRYGKLFRNNHKVSLAGPLSLPECALPIDPYVLGVWLGDGTSAAPHITCGDKDKEELVGLLENCGYVVECRRYNAAWRLIVRTTEVDIFGNAVPVAKRGDGVFLRILRRNGLLNNKHIPRRFLRASREQRLSLLQGLMDTDGTVSKNGRCLVYTTISQTLATDISELLSSLAIKHGVIRKQMTCSGRLLEGSAFNIQFMAFRDELPVFRLKRKLERMRWTWGNSVAPISKALTIENVEAVTSVPVACVQVDSPAHTYLCGRTMIPTHNSTLAAAVGLYLLALDGEPGAEVVSAATVREQAKIVWGVAKKMVQKCPEFRDEFGIDAGSHAIVVEHSASSFKALSRDADSLEGINGSGIIIDELAAHKTREVFDVLDERTGSRSQPLTFIISTEGDNPTGVFAEQVKYGQDVLDGIWVDESYFAAIYTVDDADEWTDPKSWEKANPNYKVSVFPDDMASRCLRAQKNPASQASFKTKRLNIRVGAGNAYFNVLSWTDKCKRKELSLEDFYGDHCVIGLDLASKIDLAAKVYLFRMEERKYAAFAKFYTPEERIDKGNPNYDFYRGWAAEGHLTATPGTIIDFEVIEDDLINDQRLFKVSEVAYDPFQATELSTRMTKEGLEMVEVTQNHRNLSEPTKLLQALIDEGSMLHNGDPVLAWTIGNVVCKEDPKENVVPRKPLPNSKIDGAMALIMALSRSMILSPRDSIYEDRGVRFL